MMRRKRGGRGGKGGGEEGEEGREGSEQMFISTSSSRLKPAGETPFE
jgi:hypothetical protein